MTSAGNTTHEQKGFFGETHWSEILASQTRDPERQGIALSRLLTRYRGPVVLYIQWKQRIIAAEAEDLAHDFIHHWMRLGIHRIAKPHEGRFRNFLRKCIDHFLVDSARSRNAAKRKGQAGLQSLDEQAGEHESIQVADAAQRDPSAIMDRAWAEKVVEAALARLQAECESVRRGNIFAVLKPVLSGESAAESYAAFAEKLGISVGHIKVTVQNGP